jgi:hypothetical protein
VKPPSCRRSCGRWSVDHWPMPGSRVCEHTRVAGMPDRWRLAIGVRDGQGVHVGGAQAVRHYRTDAFRRKVRGVVTSAAARGEGLVVYLARRRPTGASLAGDQVRTQASLARSRAAAHGPPEH